MQRSRWRKGEQGGSVVVAVVTLPLLLLFLYAVLDFGRVVFMEAEAITAAHAVSRCVVERPAAAHSPQELQRVALQASPSLAGDKVAVEIRAKVGMPSNQGYVHRLYDGAGGFFEKPSRVSERVVEVELSARSSYLTPLGVMLPGSQGTGASGFECVARAVASIDETVQGGSW